MHQRALPYAEVGAALAAKLAFEFMVLCAVRPGTRSTSTARCGPSPPRYAAASSCSPPRRIGRVLPVAALGDVLRAARVDAVPHGFRSSFRDWAAECTDAPHEVCELALAHVNGNRVEAAYQRTDLFDRRRVLMKTDWAAYVA